MTSKKVWIIGSGDIAIQYSKVLDSLCVDYDIIGRGELSADKYEQTYNHKVIRGGIDKYLKSGAKIPDYAINTVYPLQLKDITLQLLQAGIRNILVEKPGGINGSEIANISTFAKKTDANVYVAYNRRFFSSTIRAMEIIEQDGGVTSFNFEFTEWGHVIQKIKKPKKELENWFMANSTHVVDLAFYLGGIPEQISCYTAGTLDWHPIASRYAGAGITNKGALFSYRANWASAGRWSIEILTSERKLIFEPIEKLKEQLLGSLTVEDVPIDDSLDKEYKPGLYLQVKAFLNGNHERMIDIHEHAEMARFYEAIEHNQQMKFDTVH